MPFAGLQSGSTFKAVSDVSRKLLFFAALGMVLSLAIPGEWSVAMRRAAVVIFVLYVAAVVTTIEMIQVFVKPHVPDFTDVVLCTSGSILGMFITLRIRGRSQMLPA